MININTQNQQPTTLNSRYMGSLANTFDPYEIIRDNVIKPLFNPLMPGSPVIIEKDGKSVSPDEITKLMLNCSGDTVDPDSEAIAKEILNQTLVYYDKNMSVQDVYATQAGKKLNMLMPSAKVIYTPTDVIDASKQFIAGQISPDGFFATIAYYARLNTTGYYFANNDAWSEFKNWFSNEIASIQSILPPETTQLCQDLMNIKLNNLTESFILRANDSQNNEPYSFARVIMFYLSLYESIKRKGNSPLYEMGQLPFTFAETFCPRTLIIMNVEKHAHAHPSQIKNEWDTIKTALTMKLNVMSTKKIARLTAVARTAQKMAGMAASAQNAESGRSAIIRFRKTAPTSTDLYKYIMRIYKHTSFVQTSENAMKTVKFTYTRPSRREPDNSERPGKAKATIYKPNLHIYLDCSGSISEREYQDAIKACIKLAKKMGVDFYINSFSHYMSGSTKLKVAGRSTKEIYEAFKNIPKVSGGTNYEQIWHYINKSKKLSQEVSIIISDFEYYAPNHYVKHPKFLYYAPISGYSWSTITNAAKQFCRTMLNICPDIRKHILM